MSKLEKGIFAGLIYKKRGRKMFRKLKNFLVSSLVVGILLFPSSLRAVPVVEEINSTTINTAIQTISNFISGSRGLVTEDNSAAIKAALELVRDYLYKW